MVSSSIFVMAAAVATATATATFTLPSTLQVDSTDSIRAVAKTLAAGVMSYYNGTNETYVDLPTPYYWWECGAMFGAMLDYSYYTNDSTYDEVIATALMAQTGPDYDFMLPSHYGDEGNDDQAFWGFAVLAAAERNFPQPAALTPSGMPSWLQLGENIWNSMIGRWNTTACGGGFAWQIFASNPNGMNYRNSVSNGGIMQLSARLAVLTGNQTYADWAARIWDWSSTVGLVDTSFQVWDGVGADDNCTTVNTLGFTYSAGIYLHGAAAMTNYTAAQNQTTDHATWAARASGLLTAAEASFFSGGPTKNVTDVLWEPACEANGLCNTDMKSFKGYMSRFVAAAANAVPDLAASARTYIQASAAAAAAACSGNSVDGAPTADGATCGQLWYVGGFDGSVGLGQQMSGLETVQVLLALQENSTVVYNQYTDTEKTVVARSSASAPASTSSSSAAVSASTSSSLASSTSTASLNSSTTSNSSATSFTSSPSSTAVYVSGATAFTTGLHGMGLLGLLYAVLM